MACTTILARGSRTHAGVDNYARRCLRALFEKAGDQVPVLQWWPGKAHRRRRQTAAAPAQPIGRSPQCQFLPNRVFAAATQLVLASPARASHFSMATL